MYSSTEQHGVKNVRGIGSLLKGQSSEILLLLAMTLKDDDYSNYKNLKTRPTFFIRFILCTAKSEFSNNGFEYLIEIETILENISPFFYQGLRWVWKSKQNMTHAL